MFTNPLLATTKVDWATSVAFAVIGILQKQINKEMKIIVTGSLGHISKPLTQELVQKGHSVTVISSNPEKQKDIEAIGAKAAIGTMEDADFLSSNF